MRPPGESITGRGTPAIVAGIADHVWSIEEIVELLEKQNEEKAA
jgi:hypothetical protein